MPKKSNPLDTQPTKIENKNPTTSSRQLQGSTVKFSRKQKGDSKNILCFKFQLEDTKTRNGDKEASTEQLQFVH